MTRSTRRQQGKGAVAQSRVDHGGVVEAVAVVANTSCDVNEAVLGNGGSRAGSDAWIFS